MSIVDLGHFILATRQDATWKVKWNSQSFSWLLNFQNKGLDCLEGACALAAKVWMKFIYISSLARDSD